MNIPKQTNMNISFKPDIKKIENPDKDNIGKSHGLLFLCFASYSMSEFMNPIFL